jgi:hypothetical protein
MAAAETGQASHRAQTGQAFLLSKFNDALTPRALFGKSTSA